jgi:ABC-type amino acid transport substrate-binding protein
MLRSVSIFVTPLNATIKALRENGEFTKLQAAWPGTGASA